MTTSTFQQAVLINATAQKIYDHLSEPMNYFGLSPLLISMTDINRETNLEGQSVVYYKSVELFRFLGIISYQNPLAVTLTLTEPNRQLVSHVRTRLNVQVQFVVDMQAQANGTNVIETITANAPALLHPFVVGQAKTVQNNRLNVLKSRMEI